jgi:hypothetical protein
VARRRFFARPDRESKAEGFLASRWAVNGAWVSARADWGASGSVRSVAFPVE